MDRKSTKTVDAYEAAKRPDAKLVLMERTRRRIAEKDESSDSEEELLREDESDSSILQRVKDSRLDKDAKKQKQSWEHTQKVAEIQQRVSERSQRLDSSNALTQEEARRKKRVADPLEEVPSLFDSKRHKEDEVLSAAECPPAAPKPPDSTLALPCDLQQAKLKVLLMKAALDCDPHFIGGHNCLSLTQPVEAAVLSRRDTEWTLHCIVHRAADSERAIDAVLQQEDGELVCTEARLCSRRH